MVMSSAYRYGPVSSGASFGDDPRTRGISEVDVMSSEADKPSGMPGRSGSATGGQAGGLAAVGGPPSAVGPGRGGTASGSSHCPGRRCGSGSMSLGTPPAGPSETPVAPVRSNQAGKGRP